MPKLKKVVDKAKAEASKADKPLKKKVSKKEKAPKKAKKAPTAKKPKAKVYNVSGKFKADAEGNIVKSSKNIVVEHVKKMTGTGKPGFMVKVVVHSK